MPDTQIIILNNEASQVDRLRAHLEKYGSITMIKAHTVYRIDRLAARIHELRGEGMKIDSVRRRDESGKAYTEYVLVK